MNLITQQKHESKQESLVNFTSSLNKSTETYSNSAINELIEIFAKNPTDVFTVVNKTLKGECIMLAQGDIWVAPENTPLYNFIDKNKTDSLQVASNMNLQEGIAMTGDHAIVGTGQVVIQDGKFNVMEGRRSTYSYKKIVTSEPFLITHREHGNMAFPEGTYYSCVAIDPKTMSKVLD